MRCRDAAADPGRGRLPAATASRLELVDRRVRLLRSDVMRVQAEDSGELGQVIETCPPASIIFSMLRLVSAALLFARHTPNVRPNTRPHPAGLRPASCALVLEMHIRVTVKTCCAMSPIEQ